MKFREPFIVIFAASFFPICFWLGGFNFDERGELCVVMYIASCVSVFGSIGLCMFLRSEEVH